MLTLPRAVNYFTSEYLSPAYILYSLVFYFYIAICNCLYQISITTITNDHKLDVLSSSSVGQKSDMGLTGVESRLSTGLHSFLEESPFPCFPSFQRLAAFLGSRPPPTPSFKGAIQIKYISCCISLTSSSASLFHF